jgi:hypothetical protein
MNKAELKNLLTTNPTDPLWAGLVGAWFFDEGSGDIFNDISGLEQTGSFYCVQTTSLGWTSSGYWIQQDGGYQTEIWAPIYPYATTSGLTLFNIVKFDPTKFTAIGSHAESDVLGFLICHYYESGVVSVRFMCDYNHSGYEIQNSGDFIRLFAVTTKNGPGRVTSVYQNKTLLGQLTSNVGTALPASKYLLEKAQALPGGMSSIEESLILIWNRQLSIDEIIRIEDPPPPQEIPYDPIPTIVRQIAERNNKILGGKQTVY